MSEILLYDLSSRDPCLCWSLNPWKTRLLLNLKNIPYKTEWIEYPDIAPTFKTLNIPPNLEGTIPYTPYTIPAIRLGADKYIMDSRQIAEELDRAYPEGPSLHLDSPIVPKVQALIAKGMSPLRPVVLPKVARNLLNPRSAEYFKETRAKRFGMSLSQLEKEGGGNNAREKAGPAIKELGGILEGLL